MNLKVIYNRFKTGFEDSKDFPILINSIIADKYLILGFIAKAAFSKTIIAQDIKTDKNYCIKIIENHKDYLD